MLRGEALADGVLPPPLPARWRDAAVIAALTDAVARYSRRGFRKLSDRLRVEGRPWNHKRVHRVYCALRQNLPRRTTRRVPRRLRQPLVAPPVLNATRALDFMADALYDVRRIRCLTVLNEGNREGLEIAVGPSLPNRRVVRMLSDLVALHGRPTAVRLYNGPEVTAEPFIERPHDSLGPVPPLTFLPTPINHRSVSLGTVRVTGKLTYAVSSTCVRPDAATNSTTSAPAS